MKVSLKNFTVKQQIISLVGLLFTLLLMLSYVSISNMNKIGSEIEAIAEQDIPMTESITQITVHQLEQAITLNAPYVMAKKCNPINLPNQNINNQ